MLRFNNWFHSVVAITSASHAEGPGFEPQWNQRFSIFYFRYAFEGVLHVIYGMDRAHLECDEGALDCSFQDSKDLLKVMDVDQGAFYIDFLVLCGFFVALRFACYIALRVRILSVR